MLHGSCPCIKEKHNVAHGEGWVGGDGELEVRWENNCARKVWLSVTLRRCQSDLLMAIPNSRCQLRVPLECILNFSEITCCTFLFTSVYFSVSHPFIYPLSLPCTFSLRISLTLSPFQEASKLTFPLKFLSVERTRVVLSNEVFWRYQIARITSLLYIIDLATFPAEYWLNAYIII